MKESKRRDIIATYSLKKLAGWVALVGAACGWILIDAAGRDWASPGGVHAGLYPAGLVGAALGLIVCLALVANFLLKRGVAIRRSGDELVLHFPFGSRRLPIDGLTATVAMERIGHADNANGFIPPAMVQQVTFNRPGAPPVRFRTALLTETAATISGRVEALSARQG